MREYFAQEQAHPECKTEHMSPSGRYKLVITPYDSKPGCIGHSRGEVYRDSELVADIKRNYCAFPFSWIEDHPNGHSYLIAGEDYQGQTVIELDTGARRDFLPEEAKKGFGFCWAVHRFFPKHQVLAVDGCYWACPYEFKFYDFSDPMGSGWPELKVEIDGRDACIEADERWPEIDSDGIFRCFSTADRDGDEEDTVRVQNAISLFRREGEKLIRFSEWVSDAEQERRKNQEESRKAWDSWLVKFRAEDPMYLKLQELLKESALSPESHEGIGVTYEGWCPWFSVKESRYCKRINNEAKKAVDLDWGVETGPVKLSWYPEGGKKEEFFDHSVDGVEKAISKALELIA